MQFEFTLSNDELKKCRDFSETSAKTQREYRSGGSVIRSVSSISSDTLRGKIGEMIVKMFLAQHPLNYNIDLDFDIYPRGVWDEMDFKANHLKVSIKSSKLFARWLLLEKKDIDRGDIYDIYIFVSVDELKGYGKIRGFAYKKDILEDSKTIVLKRKQCIPNTSTPLDADNYARKLDDLNNRNEDWIKLIELLKS